MPQNVIEIVQESQRCSG